MTLDKISKFDMTYMERRIKQLNNPSKFEINYYKSVSDYMQSKIHKPGLKQAALEYNKETQWEDCD